MNESTAANEEAEYNSSMTSHYINLLEDVESPGMVGQQLLLENDEEEELPPLPPGNEFEETILTSLTSHQLPASPEDMTPFASSVAHQLIPCQAEDYEVSMAVHQVEHEVFETEEEVEEFDKHEADDTSMAAHKLSEMEPESEFLSLPMSLASHLVLPVEWPETGLLNSMVAHQIYQPCPENLEETFPLMQKSPNCESMIATSSQALNEDTFEDNLRENLKDWFMGIDLKATYGNFEEDLPGTTFFEDSSENIAMAYEVPMYVDQIEHEDKVVEENVEEVDKESDDTNIGQKLPVSEEDEMEDLEADTSMAAHKLSEIEPECEFLNLPVSLASHLVLPVDWPETGLLISMVAHQIYQPCPENLEETILLIPSLDNEASNPEMEECEVKLEENLRKNVK